MFTARFILFALVLAQLADALTFTVGVSRFGTGVESNGAVLALVGSMGIDAVLVVKLGAILSAIGLLVIGAHRFPRLLVWGGAAGTSFGLLGFLANAWSMVILG